jgi:hypothetical protein
MELSYTNEHNDFRAELNEWLEKNTPHQNLESIDSKEGIETHRNWEKKLFQSKWSMVTWPKNLGGRDADLIEWIIFEEEYYKAEAPSRINEIGFHLVAPMLMKYGTDTQKQTILPRIASGDDIWCQALSETNTGLDLTTIHSKAERSPCGEFYVLNGHKTWCAKAVFADWCIGIFRTDHNSTDHSGLSVFILPLNLEGVSISPIPQLNGLSGFAEISFDHVQIPIEYLIGEEGQGSDIVTKSNNLEQRFMLNSPARFQHTAHQLIELYKANQHSADRDPSIRDAVIKSYLDAESYTLSSYQHLDTYTHTQSLSDFGLCNSLFCSDLDYFMHKTALSILSERAEFQAESTDAIGVDLWLEGWLRCQASSIHPVTNELKRTIIAESIISKPN